MCPRKLRVISLFAWVLAAAGAGIAAPADGGAGRTVRVAAISFVPKPLDLAGNAAALERLFRRAAAGGAQLAVAPEAALDAYVAIDIIRGSQPPARMDDMALTLQSATMRHFQALAKELNLCLAFGFAERVGDDVYDAAVFIDQQGAIRGDYHKMQLAEGTKPDWWYDRVGAHCRAFDTPFGRCGMLICNDRWNADLARILALDGAALILIPTDGTSGAPNDAAVLARARENGVPIVQANQMTETLIVNGGAIAEMERGTNLVTFGEVTLAPARPAAPAERDALEARFLEWRRQEMPKRAEKFLSEIHPAASTPGS